MTKAKAYDPIKDLEDLLAASKDRADLSGSREGSFTAILMNQLAGALFTGAKPNLDMAEAMQHAAQVALRGVSPTDPVEGMFAAQIVATHFAAMECYRRAAIAEQTFEGRRIALEFANKLVRSYALLVEALNKHRGKVQQVVRVEHVTVQAGGQAIVGSVGLTGGGHGQGSDEQSHAQVLPHAPEPPLRCADTGRIAVPITRRSRTAPL